MATDMRKIILISILILTSAITFSQAKLSLIDGSQYNIKDYSFLPDNNSPTELQIRMEKKNGKIKTKYFDTNDIWSINDSILYLPTQEGEFSVYDMKEVVLGKQIARDEFNAWWACASGFVVGAGSMIYIFSYERRPMLGFAVPIVYAAGFSFIRPTKRGIIKRHPEFQDDEYFVYGYQNKGRKKIFTNTIIGTLSGLVVGGVASLFIK